jgi:hypothetical protein
MPDLAKKLRINENDTILAINAPPGFERALGKLTKGASVVEKTDNPQQVHWFVTNREQMEKELKKVLKWLKSGVIFWIYYPKGSSKIQTDLTRDKGWEMLMDVEGFHWLSLISFNETWSAFAGRLKSEKDKKRGEKSAGIPAINKWIDPASKTVRLPPDLSSALNKNKKLSGFFNALSYTNRKEYVSWVVSAKREETRKARIEGTIERLGKGWKNPSNI